MLANCYECGEKISTDARRCPRCGYDYTYDSYDGQANYAGKEVCEATMETDSGPRRMSVSEFLDARVKMFQEMAQEKKESSGCFIATAAYETPLAEEIGLLRRFRDEHLDQYRLGRAFITTYYRLSPPIAKIIKQSRVLRTMTRAALYPIIWLLRK